MAVRPAVEVVDRTFLLDLKLPGREVFRFFVASVRYARQRLSHRMYQAANTGLKKRAGVGFCESIAFRGERVFLDGVFDPAIERFPLFAR